MIKFSYPLSFNGNKYKQKYDPNVIKKLNLKNVNPDGTRMEDYGLVQKFSDNFVIAIIADGHGSHPLVGDYFHWGGYECAKFAVQEIAKKTKVLFQDCLTQRCEIGSKLTRLFTETDKQLAVMMNKNEIWNKVENLKKEGYRNIVKSKCEYPQFCYIDQKGRQEIFGCGTTLTVSISIVKNKELLIWTANVGDSHSIVIGINDKDEIGFVSWLTEDHGTTNDDEIKRLAKLGVSVNGEYFVLPNGVLLMPSRSLGHLHEKQYGILPEPSIQKVKLKSLSFNQSPINRFLIITASDGLWNGFGNKFRDDSLPYIYDVINKNIKFIKTPGKISNALMQLLTTNKRSVWIDNTLIITEYIQI